MNDLVLSARGLLLWFGFLANVFVFGILKFESNLEDSNSSEMFTFLVIKNLMNKTCYSLVDFTAHDD